MDDTTRAVKNAAMTKAAIAGGSVAAPYAGAVLSTAATASTGALGTAAAAVATGTALPLVATVAIVGGAAYGAAKAVGAVFDWFAGES